MMDTVLPLTLAVTPLHDLAEGSSEQYYLRFAPLFIPPSWFLPAHHIGFVIRSQAML
jgi:hypothetical protein